MHGFEKGLRAPSWTQAGEVSVRRGLVPSSEEHSEEPGMTLATDSRSQLDPIQVEVGRHWSEGVCSGDVGLRGTEMMAECAGVDPVFNAKECQCLLDEPAIGSWASEAAAKYEVTAGDALELLAYALFLDGEK
jgi:hypothetical protein